MRFRWEIIYKNVSQFLGISAKEFGKKHYAEALKDIFFYNETQNIMEYLLEKEKAKQEAQQNKR